MVTQKYGETVFLSSVSQFLSECGSLEICVVDVDSTNSMIES